MPGNDLVIRTGIPEGGKSATWAPINVTGQRWVCRSEAFESLELNHLETRRKESFSLKGGPRTHCGSCARGVGISHLQKFALSTHGPPALEALKGSLLEGSNVLDVPYFLFLSQLQDLDQPF